MYEEEMMANAPTPNTKADLAVSLHIIKSAANEEKQSELTSNVDAFLDLYCN